ncbi:uncharacterized protein C11orf24 homolog [Cricetulus griseus]|uniref:RIKEN cDNA 1810055G02 gene n=1 Tax=Cricetulus griseus TaxID=10029 RepID=G3I5B5_CRIGR|nr:uncharacterized protein C11orf24 homolog [Cricetulus griseus]XP_027264570.1 uncharacterized protein C11orf24 homolog [Cricetulus griseus]EGW12717.1 Uncharacterized protein C11orf24-like [Cricetulus griseus]
MWTALVLVWISSVPLSRSHIVSEEPLMNMLPKAVKRSEPRNTSSTADNKPTERIATVSPTPVTSTTGTWAASLNSTKVTAEMTTHQTNTSIPTTRDGTTDSVTSRTLALPTLSSPSSLGKTLPITTAGLSSLSTPRAEVPSTNASIPPPTATVATVAPHTMTVAAGTMNTSGPTSTLSPAKSTPPNTSTMNTIPTSGTQIQGTTIQVTTEQPVRSTANRLTPSPSNTTLEPTTTTRSVASVSSTVVTTTQIQTKEPTASTVPVSPTNPTPEVAATSPTTQPSPTLSTQGTVGPGIPLTTERVETKATAGTASAGLTPRSSGDPKVQTTDSCQLSTQGQYLVVTTEPLTPSLVNKMLLLAVLVLGVTLFIAVLVMFALQAYESYKKKDYTQVDYLINGMYADSEM